MRLRRVAASVLLVALAGCTSSHDGEPRTEGAERAVVTPTGPVQPVELAENLILHPGDDGRLPVAVRWSTYLEAVEAIGVLGEELVVVDEVVEALRLEDGGTTWEASADDYGWWSDSGDEIGLDEDGNLRAFAPWNRDWTIDPRTGDVLEDRGTPGEAPEGTFEPLPAESPRGFRMVKREHAHWEAVAPGGRVLWGFEYSRANQIAIDPVVVPGGFALATATGHVVVLDQL